MESPHFSAFPCLLTSNKHCTTEKDKVWSAFRGKCRNVIYFIAFLGIKPISRKYLASSLVQALTQSVALHSERMECWLLFGTQCILYLYTLDKALESNITRPACMIISIHSITQPKMAIKSLSNVCYWALS